MWQLAVSSKRSLFQNLEHKFCMNTIKIEIINFNFKNSENSNWKISKILKILTEKFRKFDNFPTRKISKIW